MARRLDQDVSEARRRGRCAVCRSFEVGADDGEVVLAVAVDPEPSAPALVAREVDVPREAGVGVLYDSTA